MFEAEISIRYPSHAFADSVVKALSPDNIMPGGEIRIITRANGSVLHIRVERCKRVESFQATMQDVFRCLHAAESSLARITPR